MHRSTINHAFHVWINQRAEERRRNSEPFEHDLYEWKNMLMELERLPLWLKRARTGHMPTAHQQYLHSAPEAIAENRLVCALGTDVSTCPILASLYATFREQAAARAVWAEKMRAKFGEDYQAPIEQLTEDDADVVGARVCTWHIFMSTLKAPAIDTSEGYVQDESDRRFWGNLYASMSEEMPS